jgi:homoserine O-succinyltransferase/O-acetyltransferase
MLTIGVVNNMPAAAVRSTERQFCDILSMAAQDIPFRIKWFRLAGARPPNYGRLEDLWDSDLDGLIVTGAEPRAAALPDEPLWQPLTQVVDWAAQHTASVIWSCLAAHAAVLYLDGIERVSSREKIFGIFKSIKTEEHAILANMQPAWSVPHSRWNDLPEGDLTARGYNVLAKSEDAGVDLFIKHVEQSLFVFIQTHPEYDVGALMREYRRDVARFHTGQQDSYPKIPSNYFDNEIVAALRQLAHGPATHQQAGELDILDRAEMPNGWNPVATQLYRNWLCYLLTVHQARTFVPAMSS